MSVIDLLEAFKNERDVQLRVDAAHRLVRTGDAAVIEALREGLNDENLTIRELSNALLWKLTTSKELAPQAREALLQFHLQALTESAVDKKVAAAAALSRLSDRKAVKPLIASLQDSESDVRRAAFEALKQLKSTLGGMDIRKALDEYAGQDSWTEDIAEEIRAMYAKRPEGFYRGFGWPEEKRLRAIGQMLHDKGGINLMRKVHLQFASRSIPIGASRNLEIMWDGIGVWKG